MVQVNPQYNTIFKLPSDLPLFSIIGNNKIAITKPFKSVIQTQAKRKVDTTLERTPLIHQHHRSTIFHKDSLIQNTTNNILIRMGVEKEKMRMKVMLSRVKKEIGTLWLNK